MLLIVRIKVFLLPTVHFLRYVWKISEVSTQITQRQIIQNLILQWMTLSSDFKNSEVCEIHPIFLDIFTFILYWHNSAYNHKNHLDIRTWARFCHFGEYWLRVWGSAAPQLTPVSFSRATPQPVSLTSPGWICNSSTTFVYRNQIQHENEWVTEEFPDINS